MTQMNRTLRGTARFLLVSFLAMLAASGCGDSSSSGAPDEGDNTGGAAPGTGGGATASTTTGAGGDATASTTTGAGGDATASTTTGAGGDATASTTTGAGGDATASTTAGAGGDATGGTGSNSSGAGTGGASNSNPTFHIFMLMGQSNMAGVADRQDSDRNTDARLKVLGGCNQPAGQWNLANPPLSDCPGEKGWNLSTSVDPGIWFGKTLLKKLREGDTIGLVATAESGESINTFISGGSHHQMILNKIAKAKTAENARFAGIIFHQGESDNGQASWPGKVVQLYNEVKAAWGVDYDVPFILGELPAGGCCSGHNRLVHQAAEMLPKGYWISQEGTKVMDQYHFDHASVVLMGTRYGEKMIEALGW